MGARAGTFTGDAEVHCVGHMAPPKEGKPAALLAAVERQLGPCQLWSMFNCPVLLRPQDEHTCLRLEHCQLHVGISLMAGRLEMTDCEVKCTGDSLWTHPETTLVMRRQARCRAAASGAGVAGPSARGSLACWLASAEAALVAAPACEGSDRVLARSPLN